MDEGDVIEADVVRLTGEGHLDGGGDALRIKVVKVCEEHVERGDANDEEASDNLEVLGTGGRLGEGHRETGGDVVGSLDAREEHARRGVDPRGEEKREHGDEVGSGCCNLVVCGGLCVDVCACGR